MNMLVVPLLLAALSTASAVFTTPRGIREQAGICQPARAYHGLKSGYSKLTGHGLLQLRGGKRTALKMITVVICSSPLSVLVVMIQSDRPCNLRWLVCRSGKRRST
jgi:hypothetical protein